VNKDKGLSKLEHVLIVLTIKGCKEQERSRVVVNNVAQINAMLGNKLKKTPLKVESVSHVLIILVLPQIERLAFLTRVI